MEQGLLLHQLQPAQSTAHPPPSDSRPPQPPPPADTFLIVPTHYGGGGGRSSVDFPFLAYLGYKTFGWVVVFIAVLILLRFVKLWLLHTWIREAGIGEVSGLNIRGGNGNGHGGALLRDEVVYEICLRVEGQESGEVGARRLNRALIGLGRRSRSATRSQQNPEDDRPPNYAEVTAAAAGAASAHPNQDAEVPDAASDEKCVSAGDVPPPEYSTLFVEGSGGERDERRD